MSDMPAPPGKLYDVGGYRLHIQTHGSGSPATLLDSDLGGNSIAWTNTLPAIAKYTQACAFDRAGYAWSEPAPPEVRRTSLQIVVELRTLLVKAGVEPPYSGGPLVLGNQYAGFYLPASAGGHRTGAGGPF